MSGRCPFATRRGFLTAAGSLVAAAGTTALAVPGGATARAAVLPPEAGGPSERRQIEPFWGEHQGGIATPPQTHTYFAAFDLTTDKASDVVAMLRLWTEASVRMAAGETAEPLSKDLVKPAADSGEALGLSPARLTLTFGLGAGLFTKDGKDRYGLAKRRPQALVDLPRFNGDQMIATYTGGDLSVQACADDPQVAFHAVRQLARLAYGHAQIRWTQAGFGSNQAAGGTPRNLMGFKDGTINPVPEAASKQTKGPHQASLEEVVWAGTEGPAWMRGGSYLVVRRIRMALEHWDRMEVGFQEQVFGRQKYSGAPLGRTHELDPLDLAATDKDGNPVIPDSAHVRLGAAESNGGAQILRRGYSYNDGVSFTAERWPPWHQGMEYDAGLLFLCYQRDPRAGFIKIYENMSKLDMLNQFVTHNGSGVFACPKGVARGEFIAEPLFA